MLLAEKIYIGFFLTYGIAQTIANSYYCLSKNGINTGRKQHGEIPASASDKEFKTKLILMMIFGILFLIVGVYTIMMQKLIYELFLGVLVTNSIYMLSEAMYYKYWKTFCAFAVSLIPTILFVILI